MRKGLIIAGLAVWLVLIGTGIVTVALWRDEPSVGEAAVLMLQEPESTARKEEEIVAVEPESAAESTIPTEEATVSTESEMTAHIPEEFEYPEEVPSHVPITSGSSAKPDTSLDAPIVSAPVEPAEAQQTSPEALSENDPGSALEQETKTEEFAEPTNTASSFKACDPAAGSLGTLRYWLYTPSNPTENMPLIVYLHGGSGKGDDLNLITSVDGFPQYLQSGKLRDVRAYVLIPQLPSDQKGGAGVQDSLYRLIQSVVSEYGIDSGNISLTGHSMGGTGTWSFAAAYPSLFSRIAPLSGSIRNIADTAAALKDTSVWAFVGSEDTIVPPTTSLETVRTLVEAGGNARITVLDGADHFTVPSLAYLDETWNLVAWLTGGDG